MLLDRPQFCSPREAARILGISDYLMYRLVEQGEVPVRRLGARILIPLAWVLQGSDGSHPDAQDDK